MCDGKAFFGDIKKELTSVSKDVNRTRMGCQVSAEYVNNLDRRTWQGCEYKPGHKPEENADGIEVHNHIR
jgi:hypothetical protein